MFKKKIFFSKMHGLGNDFVVINNVVEKHSFSNNEIKKISSRNFGVGCDQVLIIEKSLEACVDYNYRIFNSNGKEVNQCGNGARCVGYYLFLKKMVQKKIFCLKTNERKIFLEIKKNNFVSVNMGIPFFEPKNIPFLKKKEKKSYYIKFFKESLKFFVVNLGNPHCVFIVKEIKNTQVNILGPFMQKKKFFPLGVNVGFMQIINKKHIALRVYERDVGETFSCGSGACAAVAIGIKNKFLSLKNKVKVNFSTGSLFVRWNGKLDSSLYMEGKVEYVFEGSIII